MRRTGFFLLVFLLTSPIATFSTYAISDEEKTSITQNCNSIKSSLSSLQKTDARVRVLLGASYQTVLSDFLTPLNLRLIKNNQPSTSLTETQANLISERDSFQERYIKYSKGFEELLSIDCREHPEDFYEKLETTRTERASLNRSAIRLNTMIKKHLSAVTDLKKTGGEK